MMLHPFQVCAFWFLLSCPGVAPVAPGTLEITVVDKGNDRPVPCRIHFQDAAGKPQQAENLPFWRDHFVCPGTVKLPLTPGRYRYEVERGPEYTLKKGELTIKEGDQKLRIELERLVDLASQGWWSGDLHVHRKVEEIPLLMQAEDLHIAPVITWWNNRNQWASQTRLPDNPLIHLDGNRYYHLMAGEDEREGGALLYFNLKKPLAITGSSREYPSPMKFLTEARKFKEVRVDIEKPFWWDVPVWLASGQIDTIGLANNHMCRNRMYESEAWGRPRDMERLPPPRGNGYWTQEIYYHLLNSGLRVPPSAGSASGVLPNPVGYNRVYVHVEGKLTYQKWWYALCAGRSFVTNGPLLRVRVNDQLPGHVFTAPQGKELRLEIKGELTTRDPITTLEIIKNGQVEQKVLYTDFRKTGSLGRVTFKESGWMLVRVIADTPHTFRFASTAPFYVEIGPKNRISKKSVQFFLDWIDERVKRIKLEDAEQRRVVLLHHEKAREFWQQRLRQASAP